MIPDPRTISLFSGGGSTFEVTYSNSTSGGSDILEVSLILTGYDATWLTSTDGSKGVYLGIGWNSVAMGGTNVVMCTLYYTGSGD